MSHGHNYIGVGPEGLQGEAAERAKEAFAAGSVKLHVTLPSGSSPAGEYLWAKPVKVPNEPWAFRVDNIPFSEVGFTLDAIVLGVPVAGGVYEFVRVYDAGPWRQVWFGTTDSHGGPTLQAIMALHPEGRWKYEAMHSCTFVAVAAGEGAIEELKATLSKLCAEEIIAFYWDDNGAGEMTDALAAAMP